MKRYLRGVFGGILAIVAAFGWAVTISFVAAVKDTGIGLMDIIGSPRLLILLTLTFSVGFYLAFRAAYLRNSN